MNFSRRNTRPRLPRQFHAVWAAVSVSSIGDGMRLVALPLLTASVTDDARQVTLVSFAGLLPWLLIGLVSGVLADRFERRRVLCLVDATRAVIVAGLLVATVVHALSIPLLMGVAFLLGCGQTLYNGAWAGMVPSMVPPGGLAMANARLQVGALLAGSVLGVPAGATFFQIRPWLPLAVDALSFLFSSMMILTVRSGTRTGQEADAHAPQSLRREALEGLSQLWRDVLLRRLCAVASVLNLVMVGLLSILVLYARQVLGLGSSGYALLVAAFAVGGLVGVPVVRFLDAWIGSVRVLRFSALATCVLCACLGMAGSGPAAVVAIAGCGAANLIWNVTLVSLRQSRVPITLLGRVTMVNQMATVSAGALGAPLAGVAYHGIGPRAPFAAGTVALFLACVFLWRGRIDALPEPTAADEGQTANEPTGTHETTDTHARTANGLAAHTDALAAAATQDPDPTADEPVATENAQPAIRPMGRIEIQ